MNNKLNKKIDRPLRVIISGGGTGGHIFPAISIANAIKLRHPDANILFVGAEDRMEMTRVPSAGYDIVGLPVSGFDRSRLFNNFTVVKRLITSLLRARKVIKEFKPDIAIGVGGYASGPLLKMASQKGIPTLIQEQNSYAGVTNKLLAKKAAKICVAYEGMEAFFPKDKIVITGNPCRQDLLIEVTKEEAYNYYQLDPNKKTILILGGSLGARTINQSILRNLSLLDDNNVQLLWQCGKRYQYDISVELSNKSQATNIRLYDFIDRMDYAYKVADLVISRAGAGSISELSLLAKPTILVPSPNVAEDHQTKNAKALVEKRAAVMVRDRVAVSDLLEAALKLVNNEFELKQLSQNIREMAHPNASEEIVDEIEKLVYPNSLNASRPERVVNSVNIITPVKSETRMEDIKSVYFIGIGGIGMSNLARYFLSRGKKVAGYDKVETILTKKLVKEGAEIHYIDDVNLIPDYSKEIETTLVIYTPAVPSDNKEMMYLTQNGFMIQKRSQVLGLITKSSRALCCAGTHGKTTTSSMLAHILKGSHLDCNAFLGGILKNNGSNLLLSDKSEFTVIEADEYDRSFHALHPFMALITSVDPDHLDIYGTEEEYLKSFEQFTSLIQSGGTLVMKHNIKLSPKLQQYVQLYTYSENHGDFHAEKVTIGEGKIKFDFITPTETIRNIELGVPVRINIENSIGAMALAWLNGATAEELRRGALTYSGAKRRFDFILKTDKVVLIDDYAHHPDELVASISSVKELYPNKKVLGVFQPHLYTRTRDFADAFARSLSLLDELILLDIYPAREKPIEGITSQIIFDKVTCEKTLCTKEQLIKVLEKKEIEVLLTLGAGDIDQMLPAIKQVLEKM